MPIPQIAYSIQKAMNSQGFPRAAEDFPSRWNAKTARDKEYLISYWM